jgi:homoserine dehydrogenase
VAQEFAAQGVSIATVRQDGHGDAATLVIVTHQAPDAALAATVERLRGMAAVRGVTSVLRVEGLT